jgi:hypothetical protein
MTSNKSYQSTIDLAHPNEGDSLVQQESKEEFLSSVVKKYPKSLAVLATLCVVFGVANVHGRRTVGPFQSSLFTQDVQAQDFCLNSITSVIDGFLTPIERSIQDLDPIKLMEKKEYTFEEFKLPGGCTASTKVTAELGTISGLDTSEMGIELVEGDCSLWSLSFSATWRLTKKLTTLSASTSGRIESEACGIPIDAGASGTALIPLAFMSVDVAVAGSVGFSPFGATIESARLQKVDFDVPSVDLAFLADGPLVEFNLEKTFEHLIADELRLRVSEGILSTVNGAVGGYLPMTLPP